MGNWKNRSSRRWSYNQDRRPPRSYYDPPQENVDDGIPGWEKEFCFAVGAVPWHRVVDAKYFSYFQSQVLKWDDSAGKEAFHNAKSRFWALINGLPCDDIPRPDPDACIDEIDWNPYIDPDLILELEEECFAPVVDDSNNFQSRNLFSDQQEGCSINKGDTANPCGSHILMQQNDMEGQGWGDPWDGNMKESNNLNKADDNPWEKACPSTGWPVGGDESWGWNPNSANATQPNGGSNSWEGNREAAITPKADGWENACPSTPVGGDESWGWNPNSANATQPNGGSNSWEGNREAAITPKADGWENACPSTPVGGDESWGWNPNSANATQPNGGRNSWEGNSEAAITPKADGWENACPSTPVGGDESWGWNPNSANARQPNGGRNSWEGNSEAAITPKADGWENACPTTGWPVGGDESWGWNPNSANATQPNGGSNSWEGNREAAIPPKADGWGEYSDNSWGHTRQQPRKWNNGWPPQKEAGFQASQRDRGWRNGRNDQSSETRSSSYRNANRAWGTGDNNSWRNEGGHQHGTGYTKPGYEYREGGHHHWRGGRAKKRVSFGY
ncbi:hypothetical protein LINPERHAP1_LOCUS26967 [Linum perenne]